MEHHVEDRGDSDEEQYHGGQKSLMAEIGRLCFKRGP
jgi:hypothetical protein